MEKRSRGEMLLALFLYTFECFSVVSFSALMYQFYHFESYRDFLQNFVDEHMSFLSFLPEGIPGFYGVVIGLLLLVKSFLIIQRSYILLFTLYRCLLWFSSPDFWSWLTTSASTRASQCSRCRGREGAVQGALDFSESSLFFPQELFCPLLLERFARKGS